MTRTRLRAAVALLVAGLSGAAALVVVACGSRTGLLVPDALDGAAPLDAARGLDAPNAPDAPVIRGVGSLDCAEAGITYIYVIAEDNEIYSFYPTTGEFTLVGTLNCPAPPNTEPFSMAVDHKGTAYVIFDGPDASPGVGALYHVSTKTAACEATPFVPDQHGFRTFGMGFVANVGDAGDGGETLYVAGDGTNALGAINLSTFALREVAPFQNAGMNLVSMAELTGTGDGRLFGFFAPDNSVPPSYIVQIDPKTAHVISTVELPDVVEGDGWAFGFWGGDFYTFTAPTDVVLGVPTTVVTRYRPKDKSIVEVAHAPPGVIIVGAGVSTCAPQQ